MKKLFLNKKIINDVLYTKMAKHQDENREFDPKNIEDCFSSFKNLSTVIHNFQSVMK